MDSSAALISFLSQIRLPPRLPLPEWIEANVCLPRVSATPGPLRLWRYQKGWLDAIADPGLTRITIMKATRIGYTQCLLGAIAFFGSNKPASTLLVLPTEDDKNRYGKGDVHRLFDESPALAGLIVENDSTMGVKVFQNGGSLRIVAATSPRNFRSHDAKNLIMDEIDAMPPTIEGDPLDLAEKRTLAHPDRLIIMGSTPTIDGMSPVQKRYLKSDERVFEIPCVHCGERFELLWENISWPPNRPREAYAICPKCGSVISEDNKAAMVEAGEWRPIKPEIIGHAGFRINALVSAFVNCRWGLLAEEYLKAKSGGPSSMMVFENTVLGICSKQEQFSVDAETLAGRVETFGLDNLPPEVLLINAGCDVQNDRVEMVILGWGANLQPWILGYVIFNGLTSEQKVWNDLDQFLKRKFHHPNGYELGIECAAIDSGGTGTGANFRTQKVYDFCTPRYFRGIYAIKGMPGAGPKWKRSYTHKTRSVKLHLIYVDQLKTEILERLAALPFRDANGEPSLAGHSRNNFCFRFSDTLPEQFFGQCANEVGRTVWVYNRPVTRYQPLCRATSQVSL